MNARDILTIVAAVFLTVGPELQASGSTPTEWQIGRYMRMPGAALIASRLIPDPNKKDEPPKP